MEHICSRGALSIGVNMSSIIDVLIQACKQEPLWRAKYENVWPIATYMSRYLRYRAVYDKGRIGSIKDPSIKSSISPVDNSAIGDELQTSALRFILKPQNESNLRNHSETNLKDLQTAIGFNSEDFKLMKVNLKANYHNSQLVCC